MDSSLDSSLDSSFFLCHSAISLDSIEDASAAANNGCLAAGILDFLDDSGMPLAILKLVTVTL